MAIPDTLIINLPDLPDTSVLSKALPWDDYSPTSSLLSGIDYALTAAKEAFNATELLENDYAFLITILVGYKVYGSLVGLNLDIESNLCYCFDSYQKFLDDQIAYNPRNYRRASISRILWEIVFGSAVDIDESSPFYECVAYKIYTLFLGYGYDFSWTRNSDGTEDLIAKKINCSMLAASNIKDRWFELIYKLCGIQKYTNYEDFCNKLYNIGYFGSKYRFFLLLSQLMSHLCFIIRNNPGFESSRPCAYQVFAESDHIIPEDNPSQQQIQDALNEMLQLFYDRKYKPEGQYSSLFGEIQIHAQIRRIRYIWGRYSLAMSTRAFWSKDENDPSGFKVGGSKGDYVLNTLPSGFNDVLSAYNTATSGDLDLYSLFDPQQTFLLSPISGEICGDDSILNYFYWELQTSHWKQYESVDTNTHLVAVDIEYPVSSLVGYGGPQLSSNYFMPMKNMNPWDMQRYGPAHYDVQNYNNEEEYQYRYGMQVAKDKLILRTDITRTGPLITSEIIRLATKIGAMF